MKAQRIRVQNKNQLIAAFGCAEGYPGPTCIQLINENVDTKYTLQPGQYCDQHDFSKAIKKARGRIRRIPATCFK